MKLQQDIIAQQDAREIVRNKWGGTPMGSVASDLQERIIARIEQKLDAMALIAIINAGV